MCSEAINDQNVKCNGNSVNLRLSHDFEHVYKGVLAQTENNRSIYLVDCTWANMSIVLTTKTIKLSNKETIKTRKEIQKTRKCLAVTSGLLSHFI